MLFYLWATIFILAMFTAWAANLFGLPGNWVMPGLAVVWYLFTDIATTSHIGWPILLVILALAIIGEWLEFLLPYSERSELAARARQPSAASSVQWQAVF